MSIETPIDHLPKSSSVRRDYAMSPAHLGYRMPAEWEPHEATWLAWPHNVETWPTRIGLVETFYTELVRCLSPHEKVHVLVQDDRMLQRARLLLRRANRENIEFHLLRTNDAWIRDYGATFLHRRDSGQRFPDRIAIDWGYNSWGSKYPPFDADQAVARKMATVCGMPCVGGGIVLEGGAIDTNGAGVVMTTASCILNPNRNPDLSRMAAVQILNDMLGTEKVLWLDGSMTGDDTDGHIDQLARFVDTHRVAVSVEHEAKDPNYDASQGLLHQLRSATDQNGQPFELVELPGPAPLAVDGKRLPASYANFYIANHVVLVPQFAHHRDELAKSILAEAFPDRDVVGIDCSQVIVGLGAIHCLTQQQPMAV